MRLALAALLPLVACAADSTGDPGDGDNTGPDAGVEAGEVPAAAGPLFSYLAAGDYRAYEGESAVHTSAGPHGRVRTYLDPLLAASLAAGNTEHPVGAAAIKELYASDGSTVSGWAVMVKTGAGSAGNTWYFYEVFSTTDGSDPIEGTGLSICTGCHSAGVDFVRVGYPLQ